jgi:hypothetical protein
MVGLIDQARSDLILLITNLFESTYLFKPISSDPGSDQFYLIAKGYKGLVAARSTIQILRQANQLQIGGQTIVRLIVGKNEQFRYQLRVFNSQMMRRQLMISKIGSRILAARLSNQASSEKQIEEIIGGILRDNLPDYPVKYALVYWNLLSDDPVKEIRKSTPKKVLHI